MNISQWLPLISSVGLVLGGLAAATWAVIAGFRKRERLTNQRLETAQGELVAVMKLEAEAWKKRYEGEHEEFSAYRKSTHERAQEANSAILKLTAENIELKNKTDLSPVLQFHKEQSQVNSKLVAALDAILKRLGAEPTNHES